MPFGIHFNNISKVKHQEAILNGIYFSHKHFIYIFALSLIDSRRFISIPYLPGIGPGCGVVVAIAIVVRGGGVAVSTDVRSAVANSGYNSGLGDDSGAAV